MDKRALSISAPKWRFPVRGPERASASPRLGVWPTWGGTGGGGRLNSIRVSNVLGVRLCIIKHALVSIYVRMCIYVYIGSVWDVNYI